MSSFSDTFSEGLLHLQSVASLRYLNPVVGVQQNGKRLAFRVTTA